MLLTEHNLRYYQDLMAGLRAAIAAGALEDYADAFALSRARGDIPPL
jgi:queuine tRNA-ribosyltransferase